MMVKTTNEGGKDDGKEDVRVYPTPCSNVMVKTTKAERTTERKIWRYIHAPCSDEMVKRKTNA